jgi:PilZ domain
MRRSRRVACKAKVQLSWVAENGEACGALVTCHDISQEGMQLRSPAPVPVRSSVQFLITGSPLQGTGTVRSSTRVGAGFVVGVTFAVPLRVDPATTVIPGIQVVEVFGMPGAGEAANSRRSS